MKKTIALLVLAFILVTTCSTALANDISVTASDVTPIEDLSISVVWNESNGYYILIASWENEGKNWEACLSGLPEKLSDDQIMLLISSAMQEKTASVKGSGLIDVEKTTNKLPLSYGERLIWSSDDNYPDHSKHCWAASVSDMMELTGWITRAAETDTGRKFDDADDMFGFFNRVFANTGATHSAALDWVFTGKESMDLALFRDYFTGSLVEDTADSDTWFEVNSEQYASVNEYMASVCDTLELLKSGAALGGALNMCGLDFPLKSDPQETSCYNSQMSSFVLYEFNMIPWSDVTETFFVPDARNGLPVPVTYDPVSDSYYTTDGKERVDPREIWIGELVYDEAQQLWFSIDENCYYDEERDPQYTRLVLCDADEVDLEHPIQYPTVSGGDHAVTIMGYVMDLSEQAPAQRLKALFLSDSDNDAAIYRLDENTPARENRPNTYTMYPTKIVSMESGDTVSLDGYIPYVQTLLCYITALMPITDTPPEPLPETGDPFALPQLSFALVASLSQLVILVKKWRKEIRHIDLRSATTSKGA